MLSCSNTSKQLTQGISNTVHSIISFAQSASFQVPQTHRSLLQLAGVFHTSVCSEQRQAMCCMLADMASNAQDQAQDLHLLL